MEPVTGEGGWRPTASLTMLRQRAELLASIRRFFAHAGVMEVDTPACSAFATTDPALDSMVTRFGETDADSGQMLYLHTSPEFPMKRLLAAGSGPIYQICKVFRNGESGRFHNPEFTLLEWYRPGFDHQQLMDEVAALVEFLLQRSLPVVHFSYRSLFQQFLAIDPQHAKMADLRDRAITLGVGGAESLDLPDADAWRDLLLTHVIEPQLPRGLCFVFDFPETQASLARIRRGRHPVAERFELYLDGMEIANGFHELADAGEQRGRFENDLKRRRQIGKPRVPMDQRLLSALAAGLPDCAGVALGVDRLVMAASGAGHINEVIAFPLGWA
jgi:lysyl-tRNA synthetase class 2